MNNINAILPFAFEGAPVRIITRESGPWFVLADVCKVLEIANSRDASTRLDDDEKSTLANTDSGDINGLGAIGAMPTLINESGLYSLTLTSRKPAAKRFKKWITSEVLPAVRQHGGYMIAAPEETPEQLAIRALTILQATVARQKAQLAEAMPKVEALDRIATAGGSLSGTAAAKALQVQPKVLFDYLRCNGWIYKRPGSPSYLGYQSKANAGLLTHKVTTVTRPDGSEKVVEAVLITALGLTKLAELMKQREMN